MPPRPQTIQIYLPSGDPQAIRIAEVTTRIVRVFEIPRALLDQFLAMPESEQVAVYFLVRPSEEEADPRVYVGQTGDLRSRLVQHNRSKDFWERALVLVSLTNSLTQTHALFLEWHCLQEVTKAKRFVAENGNAGSRPHTPPPLEADCLEIFETGRVLMATLGYPMFDAVVRSGSSDDSEEVFHCRRTGSDGRGLYTSEGFVVLKGSSGRKSTAPAEADQRAAKFQAKLIAAGVLTETGDKVVFAKDHLFGSPSMAAVALVGRGANGWLEWKLDDGRTLDEVKRQTVTADA